MKGFIRSGVEDFDGIVLIQPRIMLVKKRNWARWTMIAEVEAGADAASSVSPPVWDRIHRTILFFFSRMRASVSDFGVRNATSLLRERERERERERFNEL